MCAVVSKWPDCPLKIRHVIRLTPPSRMLCELYSILARDAVYIPTKILSPVVLNELRIMCAVVSRGPDCQLKKPTRSLAETLKSARYCQYTHKKRTSHIPQHTASERQLILSLFNSLHILCTSFIRLAPPSRIYI